MAYVAGQPAISAFNAGCASVRYISRRSCFDVCLFIRGRGLSDKPVIISQLLQLLDTGNMRTIRRNTASRDAGPIG